MEALARLVTARAGLVLLASLVLTLLALATIVDLRKGELRLVLDPSIDRLLSDGDEAQALHDRVRQTFSSGDSLLIALSADDIFTPSVLESVVRITERVEQVEGVDHVVSLATALDVQGRDDVVEIEAFLKEVPRTRAALDRIRDRVFASPIHAGTLVSSDARMTALHVVLVDMPGRELVRRGIDAAVSKIAEEERGGASVRITGQPHIESRTDQTLREDLRRVPPVAFAIVLVICLIVFRTPRGVLSPVATVLVSMIWTFGAIAWIGRPLDRVTMLVPPLVLVLGFAHAVHIVSSYLDVLRARGSRVGRPSYAVLREAASSPAFEVVRDVARPVLLTGATTIVGLLALMLSPIAAIRDFGLFSAIGVACTLVASLAFAPALLHVLPIPKHSPDRPGSFFFDSAAERLAHFVLSRRVTLLLVGGLVAALALNGITRLQVGSDPVANLSRPGVAQGDFDLASRRLGGAGAFSIVIDTDYAGAFTEPSNLLQLRELQDWLEAQPEVGATTSIVDHVMRFQRALNENVPGDLALPETRDLTARVLMLGASPDLEGYIDSRSRSSRILVRSRTLESRALSKLVRRIESRLAELPSHLRARVTGSSVRMTQALDAIARGQVWSLALALIVIFVVLALLFTSLRDGLMALVPVVLPVLVFFGIMGHADLALTPTTSLIACIVLGIGVDHSMHYLAHFSSAAQRLASESKGTVAALRSVARPVTVTSAAVCLGLLTLTLSGLRDLAYAGALASASLGVAWLLGLTVTPALFAHSRIVSLWDALSLDLGPEPQRSIPLFRGLSAVQVRIVALLASLRSFPVGQRIMRVEEAGDALYVVIHGELEASVQQEDGRVVLSRLERGDLLGEAALFQGKRTADIDVLSRARLLRLSPASLDRLGRRHPRIALAVSRNLNEALADRLTLQIPMIR